MRKRCLGQMSLRRSLTSSSAKRRSGTRMVMAVGEPQSEPHGSQRTTQLETLTPATGTSTGATLATGTPASATGTSAVVTPTIGTSASGTPATGTSVGATSATYTSVGTTSATGTSASATQTSGTSATATCATATGAPTTAAGTQGATRPKDMQTQPHRVPIQLPAPVDTPQVAQGAGHPTQVRDIIVSGHDQSTNLAFPHHERPNWRDKDATIQQGQTSREGPEMRDSQHKHRDKDLN